MNLSEVPSLKKWRVLYRAPEILVAVSPNFGWDKKIDHVQHCI